MKKVFSILMVSLAMMIGLTSCKCTSEQESVEPAVEQGALVVENVISTDRQAMFLAHDGNYRWYETGVQLKNWLDEENDGAIEMVVNIFQVVEQCSETTFDTFVYKFQHFADGTVSEEEIHGFWVEDYLLNEEEITVTFADAFEKVMAANLPKPHTRQVVLRKEVGAVDANPQWIFGNLHSQIYVDAVTGEVSDTNPAFRGLNIGTPLGEWP